MKKVLQKIALLIAVITVVSHSILPHYHHEELPIAAQHHHHDEAPPTGQDEHDDDNSQKGNHNLFSFVQLDENFVPVKLGNNKFELPVTCLPALIVNWLSEKVYTNSQITFGWYIEYPPPDKNLPSPSHRGPPTV